MNQNISLSISRNIKKYRQLNHMTQEEVAGKLYLDTQYYAQLERGERNFTIEKIVLACSVFHVGIDDIIEINTIDNNHPDIKPCMDELSELLHSLSLQQLILVKKFVEEIIPHCK